MISQARLTDLEELISGLISNGEEVERVMTRAGTRTQGVDFRGPIRLVWGRALSECQLQGRDALESVLVEVLDLFPNASLIEKTLRELSRGEEEVPRAEADGGSLTEAIIRDPLAGTELLVAYAQARGFEGAMMAQLQRCFSVLQDIARSRRQYGRTMRHEKRWKQSVYEILELARQMEALDLGSET